LKGRAQPVPAPTAGIGPPKGLPIEQGAIALSCIKAGVSVGYLDEVYNSWGNLDFRILHCFKSAYKFDRAEMYSESANGWLEEYARSDLTGKVFLSEIVREFKREVSRVP